MKRINLFLLIPLFLTSCAWLLKLAPMQTFIPKTPTFTPTYTITPEPPTSTPIHTITPEPPTGTPAPTLGVVSTQISSKDGMILLYIPAGTFTMGSDYGNAEEHPAHQVYLDSFWIDRTEVTNAMYAKCAHTGICKLPTSLSSYTHSSYYNNSKFDNSPVIYVDWNMADTYCKWAGRQLPTEAQWEKAARGTDARTYPWGNDPPNAKLLNYNDIVGDTTRVGKYPDGASPYGALDMAGNVSEWVADWYNYYQSSPAPNPSGPDSGQYRVSRGGAWYAGSIRSEYRYASYPDVSNNVTGFRCSFGTQ